MEQVQLDAHDRNKAKEDNAKYYDEWVRGGKYDKVSEHTNTVYSTIPEVRGGSRISSMGAGGVRVPEKAGP